MRHVLSILFIVSAMVSLTIIGVALAISFSDSHFCEGGRS